MMKAFHLPFFKKIAVDAEYSTMDTNEVDSHIELLMERFSSYKLNVDALENHRQLFQNTIKDFNLFSTTDSRYLKQFLFKKITDSISLLVLNNPILICNIPARKYIRAKRSKITNQ